MDEKIISADIDVVLEEMKALRREDKAFLSTNSTPKSSLEEDDYDNQQLIDGEGVIIDNYLKLKRFINIVTRQRRYTMARSLETDHSTPSSETARPARIEPFEKLRQQLHQSPAEIRQAIFLRCHDVHRPTGPAYHRDHNKQTRRIKARASLLRETLPEFTDDIDWAEAQWLRQQLPLLLKALHREAGIKRQYELDLQGWKKARQDLIQEYAQRISPYARVTVQLLNIGLGAELARLGPRPQLPSTTSTALAQPQQQNQQVISWQNILHMQTHAQSYGFGPTQFIQTVTFTLSPPFISQLDALSYEREVFYNTIRPVPGHIHTWGQFKGWIRMNPGFPPVRDTEILTLQVAQWLTGQIRWRCWFSTPSAGQSG
ncbi:hypothetical protein FKW77_002989 [Venturia effusa]|uniref:Uncharacterized protein n=1 Tax=Venturia effusa TaxID=50376 RepID=A0A517LNR2_9PEZI|nr:hypothetical protein FKW77_002989 [Venturia effusa]